MAEPTNEQLGCAIEQLRRRLNSTSSCNHHRLPFYRPIQAIRGACSSTHSSQGSELQCRTPSSCIWGSEATALAQGRATHSHRQKWAHLFPAAFAVCALETGHRPVRQTHSHQAKN